MPIDTLKQTAMRWLVIGHRWLGIVTCLLFVLWFASGLVMMYVGYPELTTPERLAYSQRIDWNRIAIEPQRALAELSPDEFPRNLRLTVLNGEPVYRSGTLTLSAVDGRRIEHVDATAARAIAQLAVPTATPATVTSIERDQWAVAGTFDGHRPLHRIALDDANGTELYVSSTTGEIMLDSTARERGWNWVGAVVHWLYFRDLRANAPLWSQVVMWTSGIGIVAAIAGLWLGIDRLRIRRRNAASSITPFRGWMAWHHLAGIVGGVFLLTWIFSGWLSMGPPVPWDKPFDPQPRARATAALAGHVEATFPTSVNTLRQLASHDAREATFVWTLGQPRIVLSDAVGQLTLIDGTTSAATRLAEADLLRAAPHLIPDAHLIATQKLEHEDAYWYSRNRERTLPVLRFKFDDIDNTWIHVDPRTGRIIGWLRDSDRTHRWLFNALHSFDFRWLLSHRPLWDIVMWLLSLAGIVISVSGVTIGWRHLRRRAAQ